MLPSRASIRGADGGLGVHPFVRTLHGALVGVAAGGAGDVGLFGLAEGDAAVPLGQLQGVGHRDVGGSESLAGEIGRARQLARDQPQPGLERLQRLAGAPVVPLGLGRDDCGRRRRSRRREAGFAQVQELLVGGEGRDRAAPAPAASARGGPSGTP